MLKKSHQHRRCITCITLSDPVQCPHYHYQSESFMLKVIAGYMSKDTLCHVAQMFHREVRKKYSSKCCALWNPKCSSLWNPMCDVNP